MDNLEYIKGIKKEDKTIKDIIDLCDGNIKIDDFGYVYRQIKALEIIAEELCLLEEIYKKEISLKYKVDMVDGQTFHWGKNKYAGM